jgi:S-DNA-T family DNA segregation ATPase FtsK/SpoIIIE
MTKKQKDKKEPKESLFFLFKELDTNVKKTIWSFVFLFLAITFLLSFFGLAGGAGRFLEEIFSRLLGYGRFVLPLVAGVFSIMYFKRLKSKNYLLLFLGVILFGLGALGAMHIFYRPEEMQEMARDGHGGGYLGFLLTYLALKALGIYAGSALFFLMIIIGLLIAFNSYFAKFLKSKEEIAESKEEVPEPEASSEQGIGRAKMTEEKLELFSKIKDSFIKPKEDPLENNASNKLQTTAGDKNILLLNPIRSNLNWKTPPTSLLEKISGKPQAGDVKKKSETIEKALKNFGIEAQVVSVNIGPTVSQYAILPAEGVRLSKIVALQNDLAMALAAHPLRIEAPIPGKSLVGLEIPNEKFAIVRIRNIIESSVFTQNQGLTIALGEDAAGNYICADLTEMPHLMLAGATGAGKSIAIANIISSLLFKHSPEDLKFILIDPKRVELSVYNEIPHLLTPVIVEIDKVVNSLKWAVAEMERRYQILQEFKVRNLEAYHEALREEGIKLPVKNEEIATAETLPIEDPENLPYIVIIIDELADIMVSFGKEVETLIVRIAQKARAVGIHLILSTQRPSVEIITGLIKANIPSRIAFQVPSQIDSRTILDMAGAEKLLGKGDMLYLSRDSSRPKRLQGAYIQEGEVKGLVNFLKKQAPTEYDEEVIKARTVPGLGGRGIFDSSTENKEDGQGGEYSDDLFLAAKAAVIESKKASATLLQRKLRVGYARAARLIEMLEEGGIIGPYNGAKPREILASPEKTTEYEDNETDQSKRDHWEF